jgi:hypothetical protein
MVFFKPDHSGWLIITSTLPGCAPGSNEKGKAQKKGPLLTEKPGYRKSASVC